MSICICVGSCRAFFFCSHPTKPSVVVYLISTSQDNVSEPCDTNLQLSSLFARFNTKDIDSAKKRILGGGRTNIPFTASTNNTPMINVASTDSQTIDHLFMDYDNICDDIENSRLWKQFVLFHQSDFFLCKSNLDQQAHCRILYAKLQ